MSSTPNENEKRGIKLGKGKNSEGSCDKKSPELLVNATTYHQREEEISSSGSSSSKGSKELPDIAATTIEMRSSKSPLTPTLPQPETAFLQPIPQKTINPNTYSNSPSLPSFHRSIRTPHASHRVQYPEQIRRSSPKLRELGKNAEVKDSSFDNCDYYDYKDSSSLAMRNSSPPTSVFNGSFERSIDRRGGRGGYGGFGGFGSGEMTGGGIEEEDNDDEAEEGEKFEVGYEDSPDPFEDSSSLELRKNLITLESSSRSKSWIGSSPITTPPPSKFISRRSLVQVETPARKGSEEEEEEGFLSRELPVEDMQKMPWNAPSRQGTRRRGLTDRTNIFSSQERYDEFIDSSPPAFQSSEKSHERSWKTDDTQQSFPEASWEGINTEKPGQYENLFSDEEEKGNFEDEFEESLGEDPFFTSSYLNPTKPTSSSTETSLQLPTSPITPQSFLRPESSNGASLESPSNFISRKQSSQRSVQESPTKKYSEADTSFFVDEYADEGSSDFFIDSPGSSDPFIHSPRSMDPFIDTPPPTDLPMNSSPPEPPMQAIIRQRVLSPVDWGLSHLEDTPTKKRGEETVSSQPFISSSRITIPFSEKATKPYSRPISRNFLSPTQKEPKTPAKKISKQSLRSPFSSPSSPSLFNRQAESSNINSSSSYRGSRFFQSPVDTIIATPSPVESAKFPSSFNRAVNNGELVSTPSWAKPYGPTTTTTLASRSRQISSYRKSVLEEQKKEEEEKEEGGLRSSPSLHINIRGEQKQKQKQKIKKKDANTIRILPKFDQYSRNKNGKDDVDSDTGTGTPFLLRRRQDSDINTMLQQRRGVGQLRLDKLRATQRRKEEEKELRDIRERQGETPGEDFTSLVDSYVDIVDMDALSTVGMVAGKESLKKILEMGRRSSREGKNDRRLKDVVRIETLEGKRGPMLGSPAYSSGNVKDRRKRVGNGTTGSPTKKPSTPPRGRYRVAKGKTLWEELLQANDGGGYEEEEEEEEEALGDYNAPTYDKKEPNRYYIEEEYDSDDVSFLHDSTTTTDEEEEAEVLGEYSHPRYYRPEANPCYIDDEYEDDYTTSWHDRTSITDEEVEDEALGKYNEPTYDRSEITWYSMEDEEESDDEASFYNRSLITNKEAHDTTEDSDKPMSTYNEKIMFRIRDRSIPIFTKPSAPILEVRFGERLNITQDLRNPPRDLEDAKDLELLEEYKRMRWEEEERQKYEEINPRIATSQRVYNGIDFTLGLSQRTRISMLVSKIQQHAIKLTDMKRGPRRGKERKERRLREKEERERREADRMIFLGKYEDLAQKDTAQAGINRTVTSFSSSNSASEVSDLPLDNLPSSPIAEISDQPLDTAPSDPTTQGSSYQSLLSAEEDINTQPLLSPPRVHHPKYVDVPFFKNSRIFGASQNFMPLISHKIPLITHPTPDIPNFILRQEQLPLWIRDKRVGDRHGFLNEGHYIHRIMEWIRETLLSPENAAKFVIALRGDCTRWTGFSDEDEEIRELSKEPGPSRSEVITVLNVLCNEFPEVHIDALPGNLISCHDYRDPKVIKIHSQIFYTIERGVKEGKCVSHLVWLVLHAFVHEFSHYLAEKATSRNPITGVWNCKYFSNDEDKLGDVIEFLLFGGKATWNCEIPEVDAPVLIDCWDGFWRDQKGNLQYMSIRCAGGEEMLEVTPIILRRGRKEWYAITQAPCRCEPRNPAVKETSPEQERLRQIIPRMEEVYDADSLYAGREVREEDRELIRILRDGKKLAESNTAYSGKRWLRRVDYAIPVGLPEAIEGKYVLLFVEVWATLTATLFLIQRESTFGSSSLWPTWQEWFIGSLVSISGLGFLFVPLRTLMIFVGTRKDILFGV
ncbi:hypothetical protein BZA77DRAFT_364567 [Pyronema omphalodes]|nr:hypothetical protein BZA77DRAFT_364567 [Pyronema omphalodes]